MTFYRILSEDESSKVAERAKQLAWSSGKARTPELEGTIKKNSEVLDDTVLRMIGQRIVQHPDVQLDAIPLKYHKPKFSRYAAGDYYRRHTDAPWMGDSRTDLSCTLWLNGDYDGGELVIDGKSYRGEPGQAIIYNCGLPHEVKPVRQGERLCVITWIQSRVRCPIKRELCTDFRRFLSRIENNQSLFVDGGKIHSALLRMWSET